MFAVTRVSRFIAAAAASCADEYQASVRRPAEPASLAGHRNTTPCLLIADRDEGHFLLKAVDQSGVDEVEFAILFKMDAGEVAAIGRVGVNPYPFLLVRLSHRHRGQHLPHAGGLCERWRQPQRRDVERIIRRGRAGVADDVELLVGAHLRAPLKRNLVVDRMGFGRVVTIIVAAGDPQRLLVAADLPAFDLEVRARLLGAKLCWHQPRLQ
jgi:hypothetical protein